MTNCTRIALVGVGWWGRQHALVLSQHPDVELCAIVDTGGERARAQAQLYGARAYEDVTSMLVAERPDFVSLCLPSMEHYGVTLEVITAGYPLLVEKPLTFDLAEAALLVKEADRSNLFFAIDFNHRFAASVEFAQNQIKNGSIGDIVFATWRFGGKHSSRHHPFANLIETQCHGFDLLEHLCGPISAVSAEMTDVGAPGEGWGTVVLALRFASGAAGSLVGTYDSSYTYPGANLLEINGTAGRVVVEDTVRRFSFQARDSEVAQVWQPGYFNDRDGTFVGTLDRYLVAMLTAFRAGDPPPVPASAGYRALALAHAAIESWETGRRVSCEPAYDGIGWDADSLPRRRLRP